MPQPVLSSQAPVTRRPQTTRSVRRAFNRRINIRPSERDLQRAAREERQERLAADQRRRGQKKKENERKRAEEREKEKERIRLYGVEVVKVEEGQRRLASFFRAGTADSSALQRPQHGVEDSGPNINDAGTERHPQADEQKSIDASNVADRLVISQAKRPFDENEEIVPERSSAGQSEETSTAIKRVEGNPHLIPGMPPPSFKPLQKKAPSLLQRPGNQYNPPNSILEKPTRKPLELLSQSPQRARTEPPDSRKRKAEAQDPEEDWTKLFQSNTQIERELCAPVQGRPTRRQANPTMKGPTSISKPERLSGIRVHAIKGSEYDERLQARRMAALAKYEALTGDRFSRDTVCKSTAAKGVVHKAGLKANNGYHAPPPLIPRTTPPSQHLRKPLAQTRVPTCLPNFHHTSNATSFSFDDDDDEFFWGMCTQEIMDVPTSPVPAPHPRPADIRPRLNNIGGGRPHEYSQMAGEANVPPLKDSERTQQDRRRSHNSTPKAIGPALKIGAGQKQTPITKKEPTPAPKEDGGRKQTTTSKEPALAPEKGSGSGQQLLQQQLHQTPSLQIEGKGNGEGEEGRKGDSSAPQPIDSFDFGISSQELAELVP
ncbi:MAG: hypothetical protein LQ340_003729 [Diploschistes diacapsis]|nr:MAG: hypothetical protein LQ340_003729 [Diploschistes diacapsis]